ncbi:MAG: DUF3025 domain-containing protein [Polyangiaceae bacterium]
MRPLVAVRRAAAFDSNFIERNPLLWPLVPAARSLGTLDDFPSVETLARLFGSDPPVRFVPAIPRPRRAARRDLQALYDARITLAREVPTRSRCWHDFMNALVWGTFPRAKRALHARQHRAIAERIAPDARRLPPTRSRELDALALLDEGGVAITADDPLAFSALLRRERNALLSQVASRAADVVVFGHAIYESLVLGVKPAIVAAIVIERSAYPSNLATAVDEALASVIDDRSRLRTPTELMRVDLTGAEPPGFAAYDA